MSWLAENLPSPESVERLRRLGVRYVILDVTSAKASLREALAASTELIEVARFGDRVVYEVALGEGASGGAEPLR
jgi:hypothetical protein